MNRSARVETMSSHPAEEDSPSLVEVYEERMQALACKVTNLNAEEQLLGGFKPGSNLADSSCIVGSRFPSLRRSQRRLIHARSVCNTVRRISMTRISLPNYSW